MYEHTLKRLRAEISGIENQQKFRKQRLEQLEVERISLRDSIRKSSEELTDLWSAVARLER